MSFHGHGHGDKGHIGLRPVPEELKQEVAVVVCMEEDWNKSKHAGQT